MFIDDLDIDEFSAHEIDWMMRDLHLWEEDVRLFYHFLIPGRDLDTGLVALAADADVINLSQYVSEHKLIYFYIEHNRTTIDSYLKSPQAKSRVVIEELDDDNDSVTAPARRQKLIPRKRLLLEYGEASVPDVETNHSLADVEGNQAIVEGSVPDVEVNHASVAVVEVQPIVLEVMRSC